MVHDWECRFIYLLPTDFNRWKFFQKCAAKKESTQNGFHSTFIQATEVYVTIISFKVCVIQHSKDW